MTPNQTYVLNALRSGSYRQGTGYLRQVHHGFDFFCCIGVMCDVVAPKNWSGPKSRGSRTIYAHLYPDNVVPCTDYNYMAPSDVLTELGLSKSQANDLTNANDHYQVSFKDIANMLERFWTTTEGADSQVRIQTWFDLRQELYRVEENDNGHTD